jgi:hypothetical protein
MFKMIIISLFSSGTVNVDCPGNSGTSCSTGLPQVVGGSTELHSILQLTFGIVAAISVLFIVIGGLRFVLSTGNPENVSKARETILYAILGLVVALIAEGIVTFVIKKV